MGCNCGGKSKNIKTATIQKEDEFLMDIKRPSTPMLNEKQKQNIILFIVGDIKSCAEGNRYVDYIIRWLIEDGIRYEKYNDKHPYAIKYGIAKTPSVIIKEGGTVVQWRGIALTYKEIIIQLSLTKSGGVVG